MPKFWTPFIRRRFAGFFLVVAGSLFLVLAHGTADFDKLLATLTQRWGAGPTAKFNAWRTLIGNVSGMQDADRIKKVNEFFNRQVRFAEDADNWGEPDYWATPMESIGKGAGDCEDYSIAKYFTLREAGIPTAKLRLIYVRASSGTSGGAPSQAHMVLAYYAQPDAEPLVMDNLVGDIKPASRRPDLVPVFSFNSEGVFAGAAGTAGAPATGTGRLSRWEDLLRRAKAEGFD
ncbi:MAG: transglutaminase [Burkholderiales bacterium PBB4]|nr:MAG: transglutaminase [Burkholderiales bacterium PBB4]